MHTTMVVVLSIRLGVKAGDDIVHEKMVQYRYSRKCPIGFFFQTFLYAAMEKFVLVLPPSFSELSKKLLKLFRGALKKNYETLDMWQSSLTPPLGRYGRKKFGRLEWGRTPPPSPSRKFVSRKSINKLMACLERV